jgi:hypothetical protein
MFRKKENFSLSSDNFLTGDGVDVSATVGLPGSDASTADGSSSLASLPRREIVGLGSIL